MSALTRYQRRQLEAVRANLVRADRYVKQEKVVGIAHQIKPEDTNGGDYLLKNPKVAETSTNSPLAVRVMSHQIGSDFVGLYEALRLLDQFLSNPTGKTIIIEDELE